MPEGLSEEQIAHLAETFKQVPLFKDLREGELRQLVRVAQFGTYQVGQELYRQSDVDNALYVITAGQVALYHVDPNGVESFVGFRALGADGWLGEASVLLSDAHDVTAIAYTDVTVLELTRAALDQLKIEYPGLYDRLNPKPENADRIKAPTFGWQADDESVVKFVREHPWALYRRMVIPVGILIGLLLAAYVLGSLFASLFVSTALIVLAALIFLGIGLYVFIDWRIDFYVVTNKRVVHVDQVPGGRQKLEEAPLSAVQEIQLARNSFLAQLLDFGDLRVETFGGGVAMKDVPQPEELKSLIFREIDKVRSRARAAARKAIRDDLTRRVGQKEAPLVPAGPHPTDAQRAVAWWRSTLGGVLHYLFPPKREVVGDSVIFRKHWIALLRKAKYPVSGLVFTLIATLIWWNRGFLLGLLPDSFWLAWLVLLLVFGAWSLWIFEDWRNDLYIVTSVRIIDIQRIPFLLRETRKEAGLDKVQTLESSVPSTWARLLRYGNVIVRVPGSSFEFKDVPNPAAMQSEISKRVDQFKRLQAQTAERGRRAELSDWFAVYEQIKSGYQPPVNIPDSSEQKTDGHS